MKTLSTLTTKNDLSEYIVENKHKADREEDDDDDYDNTIGNEK